MSIAVTACWPTMVSTVASGAPTFVMLTSWEYEWDPSVCPSSTTRCTSL